MSNSTYNVSSSHGARYQGQLYIKIGLISTLIKQTKETAVNWKHVNSTVLFSTYVDIYSVLNNNNVL